MANARGATWRTTARETSTRSLRVLMMIASMGAVLVGMVAIASLTPTLAMSTLFLVALFVVSGVVVATAPRILRLALSAGLVLRFGAALVDKTIYPLPLSGGDTVWFQGMAINLLSKPTVEIIANLPTGSALWYSLIALLYKAIGVNELALSLLLAFISFLTIRVVASAAGNLAGLEAAVVAAWIFALMPMQIVIASATLREAVIVFSSALAVRAITRYGVGSPLRGVSFSALYTILASFLHTGMLGGLLGAFWLAVEQLKKSRGLGLIYFVSGVAILVGAVLLVERTGAGLDYVGGSLSNANFDLAVRYSYSDKAGTGNLGYRPGDADSSVAAYAASFPARVAFFWLAPFPWQVRSIQHVLGVVDGLIMLFLAAAIYRCRRLILAKPVARVLLMLVLGFTVVYATGVSNAGTGIRHRHKALPAIVVLFAYARILRVPAFESQFKKELPTSTPRLR
jgi:hypothetical protein